MLDNKKKTEEELVIVLKRILVTILCIVIENLVFFLFNPLLISAYRYSKDVLLGQKQYLKAQSQSSINLVNIILTYT